jgi:hypothetical protein
LSNGIFALLAIRLGSRIVSLSLPHVANAGLQPTNSAPRTSGIGRLLAVPGQLPELDPRLPVTSVCFWGPYPKMKALLMRD